jgi:oxygen-dependent protoporphyrinogen oxidase
LSQQRVVVIGAGLAGLAVAVRLLAAGREVVVLEEAGRYGGQIDTFRAGELTVELGAEGFVARSQAVPALCDLLGLREALVAQLSTDTYAVEGGALTLLPPGEAARRLGFQVPVEELGRGIGSLALGMGQLTAAMAARLGPRLRTGSRVTAVEHGAVRGSGFAISVEGSLELGSEVVLATPAPTAARLLEPLGLACTARLAEAPLLSNVSVNLLYREGQLQDLPPGSGLLFPEALGQLGLRALSIVNHKLAGRAPAGSILLRVFFRPSELALENWSDARFVSEAEQAISQVLAVTGHPERSWVSHWRRALPVFTPAYRSQVKDADEALSALGIHLAGSAFHGAGIDAAVSSAALVAARLGS